MLTLLITLFAIGVAIFVIAVASCEEIASFKNEERLCKKLNRAKHNDLEWEVLWY